MEKQLPKGLLDRLVCSKFLFRRGQERLLSNSHYSSGEAVLLFQDSVEMTLRVLAEYLDCSVRTNTGFDSLMEKINSKGKSYLPYTSSLTQLNKSRVGFKHHGLSPERKDALKFSSDLESFFPAVLEKYLDVNFSSVSLVDLVKHTRTRTYLKLAEDYHEKEQYRDSVISSAKAFRVFRCNIDIGKRVFPETLFGYFLGENQKDSQWKSKVEQAIDEHQSLFDLLLLGIDMVEYQYYNSIAPNVLMFNNGKFQVTPRGFGPMPEHGVLESLFCSQFVLDTVMNVEQNRPVNLNHLYNGKYMYKITSPAEILVYPGEDSEVICSLNSGEVVRSDSKKIPQDSEHMRIRYQGDFAYVHISKVITITE